MRPLGPSSKDIYFGPVSSGSLGAQPQYVVAFSIDRLDMTTYSGGSALSTGLPLHARMSPLRTLLRRRSTPVS
jgi:hypothetical protein